jgi:hypothetical protein
MQNRVVLHLGQEQAPVDHAEGGVHPRRLHRRPPGESRRKGRSAGSPAKPMHAGAACDLRAQHDAILVGVGTVLSRRSALTVRLPIKVRRSHDARDLCCVSFSTASCARHRPMRLFVAGQSRAQGAADRRRQSPRKPDSIALAGSASGERQLEAAGAEIWFRRPPRPTAASPWPRATAHARRSRGAVRCSSRAAAESTAPSSPRAGGFGGTISCAAPCGIRCPRRRRPWVLTGASQPRSDRISVRALGDDVLLTADVVTRGQTPSSVAKQRTKSRSYTVFTGIVEGIGKVESLRAGAGGTRRLTVKTNLEVGKLPLGASIAVNGACLTIVARGQGRPSTFQADVGPETLACTTLGSLGPGATRAPRTGPASRRFPRRPHGERPRRRHRPRRKRAQARRAPSPCA